eukprot:1475036-Rhodomonas_salina.1
MRAAGASVAYGPRPSHFATNPIDCALLLARSSPVQILAQQLCRHVYDSRELAIDRVSMVTVYGDSEEGGWASENVLK